MFNYQSNGEAINSCIRFMEAHKMQICDITKPSMVDPNVGSLGVAAKRGGSTTLDEIKELVKELKAKGLITIREKEKISKREMTMEQRQQARELSRQGKTYKEISDILNVSYFKVTYSLCRRKYP